MKWVTRERVKVDRVACPWLIKKFVDPDAEFLFVAADKVLETAEREGAIPFDVPGVELWGTTKPDRASKRIKKEGGAVPWLPKLCRAERRVAEESNGCSN